MWQFGEFVVLFLRPIISNITINRPISISQATMLKGEVGQLKL